MKKPLNLPPDEDEPEATDEAFEARLEEAMKVMVRVWRGKGPTPEELSDAPKLDFWAITAVDGCLALTGVVTNHPGLRHGARIITSPLLWISDDRRAARTLSRFYRLGVRLDEMESRNS
jgi:hypothetical protein